MDFETFFETVLHFFKNSENMNFIFYAIATAVLTEICKKIFVNRIKVELFNKFNIAVVLPFVFGALFSVFEVVVVEQHDAFSSRLVYDCLIDTATIGALASILFKFASALLGEKLSSLLKDETFSVFYNQLVHFSILREKLKSGEITLSEFVNEVKVVSKNAAEIYQKEGSEDEKRRKLVTLLSGLIDADAVETTASILHKMLYKLFFVEKTEE